MRILKKILVVILVLGVVFFIFVFVTNLITKNRKSGGNIPPPPDTSGDKGITVPAPGGSPLRVLAQGHTLNIGTAVQAQLLRSEKVYADIVSREFNIVTPENDMKFEKILPSRGQYDFQRADIVVDFAEKHTIAVRGHTLIWHQALPSWVANGSWTRGELIRVMEDYIQTVVSRYRGRVAVWDVVNEAFDDQGNLKDTVWKRVIGPEYIEMAFRAAHKADPNAKLFYNEAGAELLTPKADAVFNFFRDLKTKGVPIDGIGMQLHVPLGLALRSDIAPRVKPDLAANIKRIHGAGMEVHITELDISIAKPVTEEKLKQQAQLYGDFLDVCLTTNGCTAFVMWGFTDKYSWIPSFRPGEDAALIFDAAYNPKPAYNVLSNRLSQQ